MSEELKKKSAREEELKDTIEVVNQALAAAAEEVAAVRARVERFGRRGTEPNELFRSEFGQNSWNREKTTKSYFIEVACDVRVLSKFRTKFRNFR